MEEQYTPERRPPPRHSDSSSCSTLGGGGDNFTVDDLLDFSNDDNLITTTPVPWNSDDSSSPDASAPDCYRNSFATTATAWENIALQNTFPDITSSGDLCVPSDDMAELVEWLSNFVEEESFSSEDLQKLQVISGVSATPQATAQPPTISTRNSEADHIDNNNNNNNKRAPPASVLAKARSKRSRAAPGTWSTRLLLLQEEVSSPSPSPPTSDHDQLVNSNINSAAVPSTTQSQILTSTIVPEFEFSPNYGLKPKPGPGKKRTVKGGVWSTTNSCTRGVAVDAAAGSKSDNTDQLGRRCLHCATDKTPQWRTGPMGPKTLCNACGVRYKSGRLVPEYRPASSPTFVMAKHSNSHRKVMEMRRQKEMMIFKHQSSSSPSSSSSSTSSSYTQDGIIFDGPPVVDDYFLRNQFGSSTYGNMILKN